MTVLFFDTETTGFVQEKLPIDDPSQPYIVQLAAQLCEDDGKVVASFSLIVDPGIGTIRIPEKASIVHGITDQRCARFGVSPESALGFFTHLYQRCDLVVAHNMKFDRAVIEAAISRHYSKIMPLRKPLFCTMEAASPVLNLPPTERMKAAGFNKPKPPKLKECIRVFFDEELADAHDAMGDVVACRRIYFHLKSLEGKQS